MNSLRGENKPREGAKRATGDASRGGQEVDERQVARLLARLAIQQYLQCKEGKEDDRKSPSADQA